MDATTANFSYIYYKQQEKPGLVGMLEKIFQNPLSCFVADFGRIAHIYIV